MKPTPETRKWLRKKSLSASELSRAAHDYTIAYEDSFPKFLGVDNVSRADLDTIIWIADCMVRDPESVKRYWLGSNVRQVFVNAGLIVA